MKTVKLSYSILNAWMTGNYEEAVGQYLGKDLPTTPYMELGRVKHEFWESYTKRTGELHPELGGGKLDNPILEKKYQKLIPFSDEYQILVRGVIDLEVGNTLIDYKCGRGMPSAYVDGWQLDLYRLLRPDATLGKYICFNPYTKTVTVGVKFLGDKSAENALENIITFGGEMIDYLLSNKLLKDFKDD